MKTYILEGKTPKPVENILEWERWFATAYRQVAKTKIGNAFVSTVFLGLDHQYGDGPPLLFETMIFGGDEGEVQERYSTWDQAIEGHKRACELVSVKE